MCNDRPVSLGELLTRLFCQDDWENHIAVHTAGSVNFIRTFHRVFNPMRRNHAEFSREGNTIGPY